MTPAPSSGRDPVERLAEEFADRFRRGERPSLTEYTERYPELAEDIRTLFPALVLMERLGSAAATTAHAPRVAGPPVPSRLGDFHLLREVGRGGMGVVYEAVQESLGRRVALKLLPAHAVASATQRERFEREAKAAARLHHTNIVPVFSIGEYAGIHYYTMQFIDGRGLDAVLDEVRRLQGGAAGSEPTTGLGRRLLSGRFQAADGQSAVLTVQPITEGGPVTPPVAAPGAQANGDPGLAPAPQPETQGVEPAAPAQSDPSAHVAKSDIGSGPPSELAGRSGWEYFRGVARIGVQVAEALTYAHAQGVLHRDIKPGNLLLDVHGTVWVTDFGLAKAVDSHDLTQTGDVVGTLRYMAPERFRGMADGRSDIYSLGLTLYETLTLQPAFDAPDRASLMERVLRGDPPRPRRLDPCIPSDLEMVVRKACAREPADRYATAAELAEDLRRFLADRPVRARRAHNVERVWRWCRRNPVVAGLSSVVAGLLVAIATMSTLSAARLTEALKQTAAAEREARLREADALVGHAQGTRYSRRPGQRFAALESLQKAAAIGQALNQPPAWFDRLRNETVAALALPDIHITQVLPDGFPPGTFAADVSPDFALYARTTEKGACAVLRVADGTVIARLPELGEPALPYFGPGPLLAVVGESGEHVQFWDLSGLEAVRRLDERDCKSWAFRPDGGELLLTYRDNSFGMFDPRTGACKYRRGPQGIPEWHTIALHPTEPIAAACSYQSRLLQLRDLRTGAVLGTPITLPWRGSWAAAWSPDGRTVAVSNGDGGQVQLYALTAAPASLRLVRTLEVPGNGGTAICFHPAGDRLVTRGWDSVVHLLDVDTGRLLCSTHSMTSHGLRELRFDRTGTRLAAARTGAQREQIGLWSVADGREYRALVHDGDGRRYPECYGGPAIHPNGRLVALGLSDGVALFDVATGRELTFMPIRDGGNPCFDGDGNLYVNGGAGLYRWPVHPHEKQSGQLVVGPPARLATVTGDRRVAVSRDGKVLAQAAYNDGAWGLVPGVHTRRLEAERCNWVSVSPDGRWIACGRHQTQVKVFDAATCQRVWESPADHREHCRFSPDGRWLLTGGDNGGQAYAVESWESGPPLGPGTPWDASPDGRLAVLGLPDGVYRLVELDTGREVARLEDPDQTASAAYFTADGRRLVLSAEDGLRVWDLCRLRAELGRLGLDWDPPAPHEPAVTPGLLDIQAEGAAGLRQP